MITNFKIFEKKVADKKFWVVNNDENLKIRLFKIGLPDKLIENFLYQLKQYYMTARYFYIGYNDNNWTYSEYNYTSGNCTYYDEDYKYMGHVYINDVDIYNYNNRKEIDKYNL